MNVTWKTRAIMVYLSAAATRRTSALVRGNLAPPSRAVAVTVSVDHPAADASGWRQPSFRRFSFVEIHQHSLTSSGLWSKWCSRRKWHAPVLRFLSSHPQLLAAVRCTTVAAAATGKPQSSRWGPLDGQPPAETREALRMAALLLQKLWGEATHFSPWRTLTAFEASQGAATTQSEAATRAAVGGDSQSEADEGAALVQKLPQLLTRTTTRFVRRAVQRQLLLHVALESAATPRADGAGTTAAAADPDGGPSAKGAGTVTTEALFIASRWLGVMQHHPVKIGAVMTARELLSALRRLEDFEAAIETAAAAASVSPAPGIQFSPSEIIAAADAAAAEALQQQEEQLLRFSRELVAAIASERLRLLREGRSCLLASLQRESDALDNLFDDEALHSCGRSPSQADLHAAADELLAGEQPLQCMQQQSEHLHELSRAFKPVSMQFGAARGRGPRAKDSAGSSSCTIAPSSSCSSSSIQSDRLRPGLLLLAHPFLADPFWQEAVLLVTRVTERDVEALMLNRSCNTTSTSSGSCSNYYRRTHRFPVTSTPLELLTKWRQQQQQQQDKQQQQHQMPTPEKQQLQQQHQQRWVTDSSRSRGSRWMPLLESDPLLLTLLRKSREAAAVGQASARKVVRMQQNQHRLQRELVSSLAKQAGVALALDAHTLNSGTNTSQELITRSSSSSSNEVSEGLIISSSSSSTAGEGSNVFSPIEDAEDWSLHVTPATDVGPILEVLTASPPDCKFRKDYWKIAVQQHQQQQQQHQEQRQLIQWLSRDLQDVVLKTHQQRQDQVLLRQLLHQVQQQILLSHESSSRKADQQPPFPGYVRLGGPFEGYKRLKGRRPGDQQHESKSGARGSNARKEQKRLPEGIFQANDEAHETAEALFLGCCVWSTKKLRRELRDGHWLPLGCTETRALHYLIFSHCARCSPPEELLKKNMQRAFKDLCPQCDGRAVYRQLLATLDHSPDGFFQTACRLPQATADELQRAADAAWNGWRDTTLSESSEPLDALHKMPCDGEDDDH
ncbi:hypothetical protein Esti_000155 [Eimeria stiedai]